MSSEELPVGNSVYVSSKRASAVSGYAQDYIGQLARTSQIKAKRVGGLWYVDMESLETYKNRPPDAVEITEKEPVVSDPESDVLVSFDGKDYISANRASKLTGYNQDYVGQLARSGKILSRQVGNRWYIDRDGIQAHKKEKDALLAAVQSEAVGIKQTPKDLEQAVVNHPRIDEAPLLRYSPEDTDLIPQVIAKEETYTPFEPEMPTIINRSGTHEYEIPINMPKRVATAYPMPKAIHLKYVKSEIKPKNVRFRSRSWAYAVPAVTILAIGSMAFLSMKYLPAIPGLNISSRISLTANSVTSEAVSLFNSAASTLENLVSPELVYQRSK